MKIDMTKDQWEFICNSLRLTRLSSRKDIVKSTCRELVEKIDRAFVVSKAANDNKRISTEKELTNVE